MPHKRVLGTIAALCVLLTGCGSAEEPAAARSTTPTRTSSSTPPPSVPTKPYTVEELAATVGCVPEFQGKLKDYRKAVCHNGTEDFILLDFQTAEGQRAWVDTAMMYGGVYLVGERWVLTSRTRETMDRLATTLGGAVEESPMRRPG
jgi:hypothetical protein